MPKLKKVLIMAGGTGGHVFPGLAVAKELLANNIQVEWLGTQKGLEAQLVPEANIPLHFISISGLRGKGFKDLTFAPLRLLIAILQARSIIKKIKPDLVIGMGGFASGPGGLASWLLRVPLVVHEQNAKAGMTNKYLSYLAEKVMQGFPDTFPAKNSITTGNPVRNEIANLTPPQQRFQGRGLPFRVLVVGGSLGAKALNEIVPQAISLMPTSLQPEVLHQTGKLTLEETTQAYATRGLKAEIKPFIKNMDEAYGWADIVICRAGALTVTELAAAGVGSILIPYPHAVDDHQTANGNFLVKNNAAILIDQATLTPDVLKNVLMELAQSPEKRQAMAQAAYHLRNVDATHKVLKICEEVCA